MARYLMAGAAQLGPIARNDSRESVVKRLVELLRQAKARDAKFIVFPEMALTTFFARWYMENEVELDSFYEAEMPSSVTRPLFDTAAELGVGFYLGYAEISQEGGKKHRYNTSILVNDKGRIVGKYRKVHIPGHVEFMPKRNVQHLEKRYFEPGNLGFPVWREFDGILGMCLCYDRRWPETFRVMGLQGVEMVGVGYNTPSTNREAKEANHLKMFHNHITMQAAAYQNGTWIVAAAKAGTEDGFDMLGGSCIIAPTGEIVALSQTLDDELIVNRCDLDLCKYIKETVFNFAEYRQIESYKLITEQRGVIYPPKAS